VGKHFVLYKKYYVPRLTALFRLLFPLKTYIYLYANFLESLGEGGPWLLKDYPNQPKVPMLKDYIVLKVIRVQQPSVPVPESYKFEGPDGKFCFEIIGRAKGVLLGTVLDKLSEQEEEDVFEDLG
jgi:hypothetical protein